MRGNGGIETTQEQGTVCLLRRELLRDAQLALCERDAGEATRWIESKCWPQYTSGEEAHALYQTFSDAELLDILLLAAEELGRNPTQQEIFCVYRLYIRRRFGNWPKALAAAGLRPPKAELDAEKRRNHIRRNQQKKIQEKQYRQQKMRKE